MNDDRLKEMIVRLLAEQKLGVLATHMDGQPHNTLVAFAHTRDLRNILFATTKSTRKYDNLMSDNRASFLVDNRTNDEIDFKNTVVVSTNGTCHVLLDAERDSLKKFFLQKHPYLEEFLDSPDCALFAMHVEKYIIVTRFQNVMELHLEK